MPKVGLIHPPFRTSLFLRDTAGNIMKDSTGQPIMSQPWLTYFGQIAITAGILEDLEVLQATTRDDFQPQDLQMSPPVEAVVHLPQANDLATLQAINRDIPQPQDQLMSSPIEPVIQRQEQQIYSPIESIQRPSSDDVFLSELIADRTPKQIPKIISDVHANKGSHLPVPNGSFYYETDRTVYYIAKDSLWKYFAGVHRALIADIPVDLGTDDEGFLFYATDYLHLYRWTGLVWQFAPADPGSGFVVIGKPDGTAPNGGLWAVCAGAAVNVSQADGTVAAVTTQNLTGEVFIKGAAATAAQQAATVSTWDAAKHATDTESGHTHSVDVLSTTSSVPSATVEVQGGTGTTVATDTHTHTVDPIDVDSGGGITHAHNLSDANAAMKVPSEANGGLPLRISVVFYIRR